MQPITHLGDFLIAVLIFQLIPGPGTLNILRSTADHGLKAGFSAVAGTLLGGICCMVAAASGLEAMVQGQPSAIEALKVAGAFYLGWMGLRMMRTRQGIVAAPATTAPALGWHLRQSLAVSLTNPKVILFYFALLPLFFRAPLTMSTMLEMIVCVTGTSLVYQAGLVLVGNAVARRLKSLPSVRSNMQRVAGVLFVVFAIKLFVV